MSDSGSGEDRPVEGAPRGATGPSPVPSPPPAPPGAGANGPWAPAPPHERPPAGYGPPAEAYSGQYAGQHGAAAPPPQNGTGTAALVLGIVGVIFSVLFFPLGLLLAVIGLVLGIVGLKRARRGLATNRGMALAGTLLSVLALIICIGWGVLVGVLINKAQDCDDPDLNRSQQRQCIEDKLGDFDR